MPAVGETLDLLSKLDASNSSSSLLQQQGLSLRARESASLSLKLIFDQIKAAHKLPTPCNKSQEPPLRHNVNVDMQLAPRGKPLICSNDNHPLQACRDLAKLAVILKHTHYKGYSRGPFSYLHFVDFTGALMHGSGILEPINEASAHERSRAMEDKVKVGASSELSSFSSVKGEPVVLHQTKRPLLHHHDQGMEATSTINHDTRSAQLTIFYADTVYVYEDVPADKVQAIMFLAAGIGGDRSGALTAAQPKHVMAFSANAFSKMRPGTPPSSSFIAFSADSTRKKLINRSQAELPFARKASLARFLEERIERVKAKAAAASLRASSLVNETPERPIRSPPKKRLCIE